MSRHQHHSHSIHNRLETITQTNRRMKCPYNRNQDSEIMNRDSYTSAWGKKAEEGKFRQQWKQIHLTTEITLEIVTSAARIWQMKYLEYTLAGQPCFCHMNKYPTVFKNSIYIKKKKTSGFSETVLVPPPVTT